MFFARYTSQADYVTNEPTMIMTNPIDYELKNDYVRVLLIMAGL